MAEFCKQCSEELFGEDFADLAGLCKRTEDIIVICEGCGVTHVDNTGKCIHPYCLKQHGKIQS